MYIVPRKNPPSLLPSLVRADHAWKKKKEEKTKVSKFRFFGIFSCRGYVYGVGVYEWEMNVGGWGIIGEMFLLG